MKLIAVTGMTGSGKTEMSYLIEKKGFKKIRFGDITDEILVRKDLKVTEENEKKIREALRKEHGMEAYAKLNLAKINDFLSKSNVVIDGLYSWEEYLYLKEKFPDMKVLAVYAPPEERYVRLNEREVRPLTREQSQHRDKVEIEKLNKAGPIVMADYTILNTGTIHDLDDELDGFFEWLRESDEV